MELQLENNLLYSGSQIQLKNDNKYLNSDGFYPEEVELIDHVQYENTLFNVYCIQYDEGQIKILKDEVLQFGKEVIIKHQKSGKYLSCYFIQGGWGISLTNQLTEYCLFCFSPCFRAQILNNNFIVSNYEVSIMISPINESVKEYLEEHYFNIDLILKKLSISKTYRTNFLLQSQEKLKDEQNSLCYGTYVKIKQIESNSYLKILTNKQVEQIIKQIKNQFDANEEFETLYKSKLGVYWFKSEQLNDIDNWKIFHPKKNNQLMTQEDKFYLQNTSNHMFVSQNGLVESFEQAQSFNFIQQSTISHFFIGYLQNEQKILTFKVNEGQINQINFEQQQSKIDLIQLEEQININTIQQNWFESVIQVLKKSQKIFRSQNLATNSQEQIQKVYLDLTLLYRALQDLICFCLENGDQIESFEKNYIFYARKNKQNQDIIRNQSILQNIITLLREINNQIDMNSIEEQTNNLLLSEELQQLYTLIKKIIQIIFLFFEVYSSYNQQNLLQVLYCYTQYLQLLGYNLGAFSCLMEIFSTNQNNVSYASEIEYNLEELFSKELQQNYIQLQKYTIVDILFQRAKYLYQVKNKIFWPNFPKFLSILCISNDKVCKKNQKLIGQNMIKYDWFAFQILAQNDDKFYLIYKGKQYELNNIYKECAKGNINYIEQINNCYHHIDQLLNLIGVLCEERNVDNILYFRTIFPQKHLISYIQYDQNDEILRFRLIVILINLYIDFYPIKQKNLQKLIFTMEEFTLNKVHQPIAFQNENLIENLIEVIQKILQQNLIQQNRIVLTQKNNSILSCLYKLMTLKVVKDYPLKDYNSEFLLNCFSVLPLSLTVKQPLQSLTTEFEQFQENKNSFNQLTKTFLDWIAFKTEMRERKVMKLCYQQSLQSNNIVIQLGNIHSNKQEIKALLGLIQHPYLNSQIKLIVFQLLSRLCQPKKTILKKLKSCTFLEDQNEYDLYRSFKNTKESWNELIFFQERNFEQIINSMKKLNQAFKNKNQIVFLQRICRTLQFDQKLFDYLIHFSDQIKLNNFQQQDLTNSINLSQECFQFLNYMCQNNTKNKTKVLMNFQILEQFINFKEIGQSELLKVIYTDSYDLIESVSVQMIQNLLNTLNSNSLEILECLLNQQNLSSIKNIMLIVNQIKLKQYFQNVLLPFNENIQNNHKSIQQQPFQIIQIKALQFLNQLLKFSPPPQRQVLQQCFSPQFLLQFIVSIQDIYNYQVNSKQYENKQNDQNQNNSISILLNTILKQQALVFLNQMLVLNDNQKFDDDFVDIAKQFINQEISLFSIKIISLNFNQVNQVSNSNSKILGLEKFFSNLFQDNGIINQDNSHFDQIIATHCYSFNNYAIVLFDLIMNLSQLISEYIDKFDESPSKSKSNRNSSTLTFKNKSLSIALLDLNVREMNIVSQKLIPFSQIKFQIDNLVYSVEQYINENLTVDDINHHQEILQAKQQQLKLLYLRQLDFKGFKFDFRRQSQTDQKKFNQFLIPKYYHDQDVYELTTIQNTQEPNENLLKNRMGKKQVDALFQNQYIIQEECYLMFQDLYQQLYFFNNNFDLQITNLNKFIPPLVRIIKQGFNNLANNYDGIIQILEFLTQMLDIHTFVRQNYEKSLQAYTAFKSEKNISKSEQIQQHKAQKELQNMIINEGFFEIFMQFCDQYEQLKILNFSELQYLNIKKVEQLYYKFILLSTKLINGFQSANQLAQEKIIGLMKTNHSNQLIKLMWQNFDNQITQSENFRLRYNLQFDIFRLQYAYEFNETHTLEYTKNLQRAGIIQLQIKLIQLMTEDHYRSAQDFLREQQGFSRNYDILLKILDLLYFQFPFETFQNLNQDNYEIVIGCFDCLKELIQGPCSANQIKVCSIQFLRLCQKLLNFDDSQSKFVQMYSQFVQDKDNLDNRARDQTQNEFNQQLQSQIKTSIQQNYVEWYKNYPSYCYQLLLSFRKSNNSNYRLFMLSEIKYRCSTTLESLTDVQINLNETLDKIASAIDEKLLIKNICTQYEKFKILHSSGKNYTNEVFSHLFGEKQKVSLQAQKMYPYSEQSWTVEDKIAVDIAIRDFCDSFIIETGFSLFNILAQIYKNKQKDVLKRIYEQIDQEKSQKQSYKSLLLYNLYQSWFSIQQLTSQITSNVMNTKQKETIADKLFTGYQLKKVPGEKEIHQKKLGYRALRFYATRMGSIEIVLSQQTLKQIIFPLIPHCFSLNEAIKQKFLLDLDRSTQLTKLESLQFNSIKNIQKLKTEYKFQLIYKKYIFINIIASNQAIWKQVIFYVIVLQNLMIIITSDESQDFGLDGLILTLNIFQIVLQFVCVFIFIIRKLPYLRIKSQQIVYERQIQRIKKREIKYKYLDNSKSIVQQEDFILEKTDKFLLEQNKFIRFLQNISDRLVLGKYIFFDYEMIYFLIFTTIAIVGLFKKAVLALLLMDVFWRFPVLTAMINSVWRPIISIMLTLSLFFILQYYYSLLIIGFFAEDTNYSPYCKNLQQCFSFIVDVTFKKDSGSPGYVAQTNDISQTYADPNFHYDWLNFWEFVYYFFVISLTYSIFTGLILDSFGADREDAEELEQDIMGQCLVCGIDKSIIEKKTKHKKGFRFHIKNEHSVWKYIFFISYIQVKKQSEYNGVESYVDEMLKNENISWLPIGKALSIVEENQDDEIEQEIQNKINQISKEIDKKITEKTQNKQKLN